MKKKLKIVCFSDTHSFDYKMEDLPEADIAIFAGDMSLRGWKYEIEEFFKWYSRQKPKHKVFIAGNHDYYFHFTHKKSVGNKTELRKIMPDNLIYLNETSVTIEGVKIWGSPWTPWFRDWAFNALPGKDIQKHWAKMDDDADIVVTHGPMANTRLDRCADGRRVGCPSLMNRVIDVMPKMHVCGHIHEAYGTEVIEIDDQEILAVNASVLNLQYMMRHKPVIVEMDTDKSVKVIDEGYLDLGDE